MIRKTYWNLHLRGRQVYYRLQGYKGLADPLKLVSVPPTEIKWIIPTREFEESIPLYGIMDGPWDQHGYSFRDNMIYDQFLSHFKEDVPWEETDRYQEVLEKLQSGEEIGCLDTEKQSIEEYHNYLKYLDSLYGKINQGGYKTQAELDPGADYLRRRPSILNEVTVFVGRDGKLICQAGKHRVTISQVLDIALIPVRIGVRHEEWQSIREEIVSIEQLTSLSNEASNVLDHPDLQDIAPKDWTRKKQNLHD